MANAVDLGSKLLMCSGSPSLSKEEMKKILKVQNRFLSWNVIVDMLKEDNLNGLHRQPDSSFTHEVINQPGFKDAVETVTKTVRYLRETRKDEFEGLVGTLDISDSQLYSNYRRVQEHLMTEVKFGRIGTLFFFVYVLSKRLHKESRQREIESVIQWLNEFLDDTVAPWLVEHHNGDWVSTFNV